MAHPFSLPRSLAAPLGALLLVLGSTTAAVLAQPAGAPTRARLTPAQGQKIFPELRTLALQDHRERIAALQKAESCLEAARTHEALRTCMKQERTAAQEQRRRYMAQMRTLFEKNGLPLPEGGKGRGGREGGQAPVGI